MKLVNSTPVPATTFELGEEGGGAWKDTGREGKGTGNKFKEKILFIIQPPLLFLPIAREQRKVDSFEGWQVSNRLPLTPHYTVTFESAHESSLPRKEHILEKTHI